MDVLWIFVVVEEVRIVEKDVCDVVGLSGVWWEVAEDDVEEVVELGGV